MRLTLSKLINKYFYQTPQKYGLASRIGGSSSQGLYQIYAGNYINMPLYKIKQDIINQGYGTTIITTPDQCHRCVQQLKKISNIVAWDTQTIDLDIKHECPVGKGKIICASFFAGPEYDFGNGPKVFIDNFGINAGLIGIFKEYLQKQQYLKVWHNYGFDRHVFYNHGINIKGFGGDTLHMARLYDSSKMFGQYSLAALTKQYRVGLSKITQIYYKRKTKLYNEAILNQKLTNQQKSIYQNAITNLQKYIEIRKQSVQLQKVKLDQLFKRKKILKGGQEGKTYQFPTTLTLHTKQQYIPTWIAYSVLDSQSTFFLRQALQLALKNQKSKEYPGINNIWEIYQRYWRPFGQLLTDMQRQGFKINMDYMKQIQQKAIERIQQKRQQFVKFLFTFQNHVNIDYFNPSSTQQLQHLLHAPFKVDPTILKKKQKEEQSVDQQLQQVQQITSQIEDDQKKVVKRQKITELQLVKCFKVNNYIKQRGGAKIQMEVVGLGIPPISLTPAGLPSVDQSVLNILAGTPSKQKYGKAYQHFKNMGYEQFGKDLSKALQALIDHRHTETLLQTFIQPLQGFADQNNRIHCSLNINTQTGRLSSRKPNLQNQPALEKDIYKIRSAFTCDQGKKLIVADYSQLQLRVLAHLSNCKTMIQSFFQGGDFHSRTAIGMFNYIKQDIDQGKVLLQWDKSKGPSPSPLLKEKYQAERRKAKTVNFSIAYGKTPKGFATDWNCSIAQAKNVIDSWFKDRPEVEAWQKKKQQIAKNAQITQTLLGRYRKLDRFFARGAKGGNYYGMGLRRAINTPIQGGAADIVIAAMVKIHQNKQLQQLGWKLLLQIHDQLILQGPQQSAQQAVKIVKQLMGHPFQKDLSIQLEVQAKIGTSWYQCK